MGSRQSLLQLRDHQQYLEEQNRSKLSGLTELMDDEHFLLMVFEYLLDYGLHDCRLVCRKWNKVCKEFPVALHRLSPSLLQQAVHAFPNATTVSTNDSGGNTSAESFSASLSSLSHLECLKVGQCNTSFPDCVQLYFQSLPQLMDLTFGFERTKDVGEMIASIKFLTNLTRLRVRSLKRQVPPPGPLLELERIRELEVDVDLLADQHDNCYFPSLTNLTRLDLVSNRKPERNYNLSLEAVRQYASTLEFLSVRVYSVPLSVSFLPLESLTKLRTLEVARFCLESGPFWDTFKRMHFVEKLRSCYLGDMSPAMRESIVMSKGLRAIECPNLVVHEHDADSIPWISEVARLTELAACLRGDLIRELGCLVHLERLCLVVPFCPDCSVSDGLVQMRNLRDLAIRFRAKLRTNGQESRGRLKLASSALSRMHQLRSVSLKQVEIDESFFQELATKTELKALSLANHGHVSYSLPLISQVNLLTNLEELTLSFSDKWTVCEWLSPKDLSKLKKLEVRGYKYQIAALKRRWACQGGTPVINGEATHWFSRSILS